MIKDLLASMNDIYSDSNLNLKEKSILMYLIKQFNIKDNYAYPKYEDIMSATGIGRRANIADTIKSLVVKGYITVKKTIGNKSHYFIERYLHFVGEKAQEVDSNKKQNSTKAPTEETPVVEEVENEDDTIKPIIVSDCKESGLQMTINDIKDNEVEISEYSIEHQQKIGLVLKQGIKLSQKQEFLIGDMDLEALRKAIHQFKKKKGKYFSLLLSLYIDQAEEAGVYVSRDIEKYLKGSYIRLTPEERETQEALRELELYGVPYGA
ncbi:hypothetical protein ACQPUY_00565 [Clostridium nigeriense]|uniref:hypothetical protein n=1 Tax=Clostridium nigeriense TaxID=1805470 RepID=UPI003D33A4FD